MKIESSLRCQNLLCLLVLYSLVKIVYGFASEANDEQINTLGLELAIRRNFSGLDDFNPLKIFAKDQYFPLLKDYVQVNCLDLFLLSKLSMDYIFFIMQINIQIINSNQSKNGTCDIYQQVPHPRYSIQRDAA